MRLCRDCFHYRPSMPQCRARGNIATDYVNGSAVRANYHTAQAVRTIADMCGPEARWFQPKAPA